MTTGTDAENVEKGKNVKRVSKKSCYDKYFGS